MISRFAFVENVGLTAGAADFLKNEIGIKEVVLPELPGLAFHAYEDLAHSTSNEELDDLKSWLAKAIPS